MFQKELSLTGKNLQVFPKETGDLKNLECLILYSNQIKIIPKEIGELKNLEYLHLYSNQIEIIPKEIGELKNLEYLSLDFNQIKIIPKEIGELKNLKDLCLSSNQIKIIPKEIGELKNLEYLSLFSNQIKNIPKEIGEVKNLKNLSLSSNQIEIIPKEIGELKNLKHLNLHFNQIEIIPKEIGELKNLERLSLSSNQIKIIPKEIGELKNLEYLYLHSNQMDNSSIFLNLSNIFNSKDLPENMSKYIQNYLKSLKEPSSLQFIQNSFNSFYIPNSIHSIIKLKSCTNLSKDENKLQQLYFCNECLVRHLCKSCADICHKNHKIYPMTVENKSCACGLSSKYSNKFKCLCYDVDEYEIKFLPEYPKNDFKNSSRIKKGGEATVYLAEYKGKQYAIKEIIILEIDPKKLNQQVSKELIDCSSN
jgi:Leucine-rich repeat (LRR) protein